MTLRPTLRPARLGALALLCALAAPASAQDASAQDADGVRAAVDQLFDGMRAADTTAIRAVLHPEARLFTAAGGAEALVPTGIGSFLAAVADAPVPFDERVGKVEVRTDGALATAWMPYRFYAGDRFSHCGVNAVQLVYADSPGGAGWRIVQVIDTRRTEGCE
ncbi:nuclear transport factor 2 family protein [Rubrivirga litoralis]|uniref:Nuclear transport factor 2 family protein n=1 Tax=Rubrivirga litoralis TaxID=3075598 RepID=A0ABU3BRG2_9BACT|nr:nuclear transport factor 2 family protein [Rubrivirga sp. F394]MDT0631873.1 nuclear transport factor 2 family protein [Rubrivirga sp. F394]